jgi:hypothetical protein
MTSRERAILRSVIYASLFDYPLTLEQLHRTLIESDQSAAEILAVYDGSALLQQMIEYRDGLFFPAGRGDLVAERARREARSREFLHRNARLLRLLCALPFTRLVALSGSVAHMNLESTGDLDLFIVTRGRRVWTVTVAVLLVAKLLKRRQIVCANFVVADTHLTLEQQDLFTANQAIHLRPLIGGEVCDRVVGANPFIARFYPNATTRLPNVAECGRGGAWRTLKTAAELALIVPSPLVELVCRRLYTWHLRRRAGSWRSPEQVSLRSDYLKLHTQSHRRSVLARFDAAVDDALDRAVRELAPQAAAGGHR